MRRCRTDTVSTYHSRQTIFFIVILSLLITLTFAFPTRVDAADGKVNIMGKVYEFDKKSDYEISSAKSFKTSDKGNTYGSFFLDGKIVDTSEKKGVPAFAVDGGNLKFSYTYGNTLLKADEKHWHLFNDKSNKIDGMALEDDIQYGAIILQTSRDGKKWVDNISMTNVFKKTPTQTKSFFSPEEAMLSNGCYFRIIIAYETRIKESSTKILFVHKDNYKYKKKAEVYEFYAFDKNSAIEADLSNKYYFNTEDLLVNTGKDTGYSGSNPIDEKDPQFGWKKPMGKFFISGFTNDTTDAEGNPVFLKTVGDKVALWFNLQQDINKLNGDERLSINEDKNGYDQDFNIEKINFGKGTLIVRFTDYEHNKQTPQVYTNYLEAYASPGADTKVQLFEEGDYEVALDYEIQNDVRKVIGKSILPEYTNYRIFFKFLVRNGNCMIYPKDVKTNSELTNSSITNNGFYLDLAKSRYLDITIKKEILTKGADGLTEDVRFNKSAQDGEVYTDEGIYIISVSNQYTGQQTKKKIYVGTNNIMKAAVTNGLSIQEVNAQVADGAQINDDGEIILSAKANKVGDKLAGDVVDKGSNAGIFILITVGVILLVIFILLASRRNKHRK